MTTDQELPRRRAPCVVQEVAPSYAVDGAFWYKPSTSTLYVYDGGSWDSISGGGGAPADASYVTTAAEAGLSAEHVLQGGAGVGLDASSGNAILTGQSTIFITNAEPSGGSAITNENYETGTSPANKVLKDADTDGDVTIHVEVDAGPNVDVHRWQPTIVVKGGDSDSTITNLSPVATNTRRFTGSVSVPTATPGTYSLYAEANDGAVSQTVSIERLANPPSVLSVAWNNQGTNPDPYPGVQTQFGNNQTMSISGTCESHADEVYVKDVSGGATQGRGLQGPFTVTGGSFGPVNVQSGAATNTTAHLVLYCKVTGGSNGPDFNSETDQTAATVVCDQTNPNLSLSSIVYPAGPPQQEAIKDAESAQVTVADSNRDAGDTYVWSDPGTMSFTISNTEGGGSDTTSWNGGVKWCKRVSGGYWDSGTSFRVVATRTEKNGHSATLNMTVRVAHDTPVLTVNTWSSQDGTNAARLRLDGGSDNPITWNNYLDHNIRLVSDQTRLSTTTPNITGPPVGTFQGSWSAQSETEMRRDLRIASSDYADGGQVPNNYAWNSSTSITWTNKANRSATTITTNNSFSVGGFDKRTLTHDIVPDHEMSMGCKAVDTSKYTVTNVIKGATQAFEASIQHHNDSDPANNNYFTISDGADGYDADGTTYHNSDKKFADTVTVYGSSTIEVEETA